MSKNSEFAVTSVQLSSTNRRFLFAEDAVSLMRNQSQSKVSQLCEVREARITA